MSLLGEALNQDLDALSEAVKPKRPNDRRGTSNKNVSGSSYARRARRAWLLETFRADRDVDSFQHMRLPIDGVPLGMGEPACRCYRCGVLLTIETLEVDRIIPGCLGGTYRRNNIRPACGSDLNKCNQLTGNQAKALKAQRSKR